MRSHGLRLSILPLVAVFCGCGNDPPAPQPINNAPAPAARVDSPEPEEWVSKPTSEWPQIVLTNHAEFHGHTALQGASSFLIRTDDGRVLAATAAHLIGSAGGVDPPLTTSEVPDAIRVWKMFPRTKPEASVAIRGVGLQGLDYPQFDWLVLTIDEAPELPAYPLRIRSNPVQIGETLYLIGCPYIERDCTQNVYTCRVTERVGIRFRYDLDPPVDIRGFSGAPIVDRNGYLVGVMTVWFHPRMDEEKYLEAGGEDAETVFWLLKEAG